MSTNVFENSDFYVEVEQSSIPWLKIFAKEPYRELSDLPDAMRLKLFEMTNRIEKVMRAFYHPDKINIASFGNYLPQVHMHVMARFKEDAFFPEPMWGLRQRDDKDYRGDWEGFLKEVKEALEASF